MVEFLHCNTYWISLLLQSTNSIPQLASHRRANPLIQECGPHSILSGFLDAPCRHNLPRYPCFSGPWYLESRWVTMNEPSCREQSSGEIPLKLVRRWAVNWPPTYFNHHNDYSCWTFAKAPTTTGTIFSELTNYLDAESRSHVQSKSKTEEKRRMQLGFSVRLA